MPTYNRSALLNKRIPEYVAHMGEDMELHVRDNGSTDDTWDVLTGMPHRRVKLWRDTVGTHVKTGFLRVLWTAAQESDYVVLMSDEDVPDWGVLPEFEQWLWERQPVFASTRFDHSQGFSRGRDGGEIPVTVFFHASFYCSGLVYRSRELLEALDLIWPLLDEGNDFLKIYAESGLVLAMFNHPESKLWAPHYLCRQVDQWDTHIVMDDGSRYWQPENRKVLFRAYEDLCDELLGLTGNSVFESAKSESLISSWR